MCMLQLFTLYDHMKICFAACCDFYFLKQYTDIPITTENLPKLHRMLLSWLR